MDTHLAQLIASVARIEGGVANLNDKVEDLKEASIQRLNAHAAKIDSLEQTRDRQRGAAKVLSGLGVVIGSLLAYLKWN